MTDEVQSKADSWSRTQKPRVTDGVGRRTVILLMTSSLIIK